MRRRAPLATRRRRAVVFVAVLVVGLSGALAVASADRPSVVREVEGEFVEARTGDPPRGFEDEVLRLDGREDVRVEERLGLVGFSCSGAAEETFSSLEQELQAKGWLGVESGNEEWRSFVKNSGTYRWAFVACVRVGAWTSVVVRYATAAA